MKPDRPQHGAALALTPFEPWAGQRGFSCSVNLRRKDRMLLLCYSVHGPLEQLILPPASDNSGCTPGLWRSTCMECFLRSQNSSAYIEWNFSPAGNWWVCTFERYRVAAPQQPEDLRPLRLHTRATAESLDMQVGIPLNNEAPQQIDTAVILQHTDERRSHWARFHEGDRPDFHRPTPTAL